MSNSASTPADSLRIALVGAGKMARHHAAAIQRSSVPARLVAVADPSAEARASIRAIEPGLVEADSLDSILETNEIDVVHICTPPSTHTDLAVRALEAGCHVYVEKPLAPTEADATRILETADRLGLSVCPGHQLLFERPARETLSLLSSLGEIQHVESYFAFRPVRGKGDQAPIPAEDQLLDVLPHPVYVLLEALEEAGLKGPTTIDSLSIGSGTLHALLRRGGVSASLVVTLTGRPVDSYLRLVGTNGSVQGDFVRGIVLRQIGPGSSGIDKLLAPYRTARQLVFRTTGAMARRFATRNRSYPGLREIFEAFYAHVQGNGPLPVGREGILETVRMQERVSHALYADRRTADAGPAHGPRVLVTGGTGFLGGAVVERLRSDGRPVRVLARRPPPRWERIPGVEYVTGDLAQGCEAAWLEDTSAVIHCAAATAGGWEAHQAASIDATEHLLAAIQLSDCEQLIHVSSIAVVDEPRDEISESSPYLEDRRASGPYAWGKLESELLVRNAESAALHITIVRPGAIVDYEDIDPPGRLGKRIGNLFVAVGARGEKLGVVGRQFCADLIVDLVGDPTAPGVIHALDPELPTRRHLVGLLQANNPDLMTVWVPRWTVRPLGWAMLGLQRVLRPGAKPIDVAAVFGNRRYDTSRASEISQRPRIAVDVPQSSTAEADVINSL